MVPGSPATRAAPVCDPTLPKRVQEIFTDLVTWAVAAKIPMKQIDSVAFTGTARCMCNIERAERIAESEEASDDARVAAIKLSTTLEKDLQKWLEMIGGTNGSRVRAGQKPEVEKRNGPLAALLAARQDRRA
jgi:hypothetical protein